MSGETEILKSHFVVLLILEHDGQILIDPVHLVGSNGVRNGERTVQIAFGLAVVLQFCMQGTNVAQFDAHGL